MHNFFVPRLSLSEYVICSQCSFDATVVAIIAGIVIAAAGDTATDTETVVATLCYCVHLVSRKHCFNGHF